MMKTFAHFCCIFLLVLGCQSTKLRNSISGVTEKTQNNNWLRDYRLAQKSESTQPEVSCERYKSLSEAPGFPLRDLAALRAREFCNINELSAYNPQDVPVYLKDLALEMEWRLAVKSKNEAMQIDLALEKSKLKLPQSEKLRWMQLAINQANKTNSTSRIPELQKRLYMIAPRLNPNPLPADFPAVAQDFRMARKFAQANELYEKVIAGKKYSMEERISAFKGLRLSYKNSRQNESHLGIAKRFVEFLQKARLKSVTPLYEAQIYLARALWTQGDVVAAQEVLQQVETRLKGKVSLAELYWIRGRMSEEKNDHEGVTGWLDLALKEKITNPELKDKILWYAAWNQRRQKQHERAIELFAEMQSQTKSDVLVARSIYWHGRSLLDLQKSDEAKVEFERLVALDPLGYYGMLAHQQLGLAITMPKSAGSAPLEPNKILNQELAEWLHLTAEKDVLTAYLDYVSMQYRKEPKQTEAAWTTIFKYYARAGLFVKLYENLSTLDGLQRKAILESHPDLLFPQPWNEHVREASLQFGVDEEFIYAIMRQESAFDPRARSGADAFGLMQVLPEVGSRMAGVNKIPYTDMEDLYTPNVNISVGAAHIKELLKRNKNQFILAVASYNASEKAIQNWMKNRFRGDSQEFIEEIPYEETRTYVRLVMRNMVFYRLLKSKSASIDFPAWVLKLDHSG